jgi:microcystin-dependent protein
MTEQVKQPRPSPLPPTYLGQVELFSFNFAPEGWAPCNGQLLPISQNVALMELIGTTYGGNGHTTFALPDLPPRSPEGPHYFIALQGAIPSR